MVQRADVLRHDVADTRASMTVKLAMLEGRVLETVADAQTSVDKVMEEIGGIVQEVRGTVEDVGGIVQEVRATVGTTLAAVQQGVAGTQASVLEIVEHVKGTLEESVAAVKRTLNVPTQVQQHPWPMLGGAVLAGYMLGRWSGGHPSAAGSTKGSPDSAADVLHHRAVGASRFVSPAAAWGSSTRSKPQPGIVSGMVEQLKDEMQHEITSLTSAVVKGMGTRLHEMFQSAISTAAAHSANAQTLAGGRPGDGSEPHQAARSSPALNGVPS